MMLLAALLAGPLATPAADTIQYRAPEALVVDKDGKPLFRATRDFLLQIAGNPDGRVIGYDAARRMVRVSQHNEWWVPCSDLHPQAVACAGPAKPKTRSITLPPQSGGEGGPEAMGRGLPSCPGDPRCPNAG